MKFATAATVLLASLLSSATAIESFLEKPNQSWTVEVPVPGPGNACVLPADSSMLFCTAADGRLSAHSTTDGMMAWEHIATGNGTVTCTTGITVGDTYMVYAATDTEGILSTCKVYAVNMGGTHLWSSEPLDGACSGTPVMSGDGNHVFLTHSTSNSGTFSVIKNDGSTLYQSSDPNLPLAPPGIYHRPAEGSYTGGQANNNDIIIWGNAPLPLGTQTSVSTEAKSYVFQFPSGFVDEVSELAVVVLLDSATTTGFQTTTAPLITNGGTSMYWGTSRSEILAWPLGKFDVPPGGNKVNFPRGNPPYLPPLSEIALTDSFTPVLFSSGAGTEFGAVDTGIGGNLMKLWEISLTTEAHVKPQVSPDNAVVYTIEDGVGTIEGAIVHQINAADGNITWSEMPGIFVTGSGFAQSKMGDMIYFAGENIADGKGKLFAWQVATLAPTTMPPVTMTPAPVTAAPTTMAPVMTAAPVMTGEVTAAPVMMGEVTAAPVMTGDVTEAPDGEVTEAPDVVTPAPTDAPGVTPAPVTPAPVDAGTTEAPTESGASAMMGVVVSVVAVVGSVMLM